MKEMGEEEEGEEVEEEDGEEEKGNVLIMESRWTCCEWISEFRFCF